MVPRKKSRRAIGNASTKALVDGLHIYGPHALGFFLFSFVGVVAIGVGHKFFGIPLATSISGVGISLALGAVTQIARSHRARTRNGR